MEQLPTQKLKQLLPAHFTSSTKEREVAKSFAHISQENKLGQEAAF